MLLLQELQLLCGFFLSLCHFLWSERPNRWTDGAPMRPCSPPPPTPTPAVGGCGPAAGEQLRPAAGCQTYIFGLVSEAISSPCVTINARRDAAPLFKVAEMRCQRRKKPFACWSCKLGFRLYTYWCLFSSPHRPHIDLKSFFFCVLSPIKEGRSPASCTSHSTVGVFQSKPCL